MKRKIHLYGSLAEKYGDVHTFFVQSVGEAVKALKANFPDFYNTIRHGKFHILRGESLQNCTEMQEEELIMLFDSPDDFHIMPVIEGGKSGWLNMIVGAILIAASFLIPGAAVGWTLAAKVSMISLGISLVAGGAAMLLTSIPRTENYGDREKPEERGSFIFNGPVNKVEQGGPVPLVYGQMLTGSVLIAGALDVEQMI